MRQTLGLFDYVRAAFSARPFGMFVPPNWIGVGALALLGLVNPGFWVLGAGIELGYLAVLATNARFQRIVAAGRVSNAHGEWQQKIVALVGRLGTGDRRRYDALALRCHAILDHQLHAGDIADGLEAQRDGLGRLLWMFLRLLIARQAIDRVLNDAGRAGSIDKRVSDLEAQIAAPDLDADLRRSLSSQSEILRQRLAQQTEARQKLAFLDAELTRIQEQVELVREQSVLSTDPEVLSQRIDQIAATLGGTAQWIRDQQQVYGAMEDLLTEPPPLASSISVRETQ